MRPMLGWTRSHSSEEGAAAEPASAAWCTPEAPAKSSRDGSPSRTWFSTSREASIDGQHPQRTGGGLTCSAVMLVCTVALALTTVVVMLCWILYVSVWPDAGGWRPPSLPRPALPELPEPDAVLGPQDEWFDFKPECGKVEKDLEYKVGKHFTDHLDHIPSWEMCCAMCQGIQDCEAWVWKENKALKDGEPHSCFIFDSVPSGRGEIPEGRQEERSFWTAAAPAVAAQTLIRSIRTRRSSRWWTWTPERRIRRRCNFELHRGGSPRGLRERFYG
ncbi:unnamed protein product, partial [Prorocentrum cordatum]